MWSQAAWFDDELRSLGVKGSMNTAKTIGTHMRRLGAGALRRDDVAQELTFRLRAAAGRRREENLAKLAALRAAQKSPS